MTHGSKKHYLGEEAYGVRGDGTVFRTAVSALSDSNEDGIPPHSFLDYSAKHGYFFSLDVAILKAKEVLESSLKRDDITKADERVLIKRLAHIADEQTRKDILTQPLTRSAQLMGMIPARKISEDEAFPTDHFLPGEEVYGIITPTTHYLVIPSWRPRPYFLLKERVTKVEYNPLFPGKVIYRFSGTKYTLTHDVLSRTEQEARAKLATIFEEQTGGTIALEKIRTLDASDEKKAQDANMKEIMKRVTAAHA